ncbi:hypothetical protein IQ229_00105 [Nostoc cf. edaphicum LEGE 07299]|uniref:Uncharacterized protein n=1 Tax=Nostoc cf. edaphicum LEGE 07299 TaxID=2777974 RepID=A0ABR9TSP4_9NOSO|nr:hypothetical protein [Nostoc edaphicum]MBE9103416.1 hypothetical protein [Nostoc cf. edaphicum LEGE 07299]
MVILIVNAKKLLFEVMEKRSHFLKKVRSLVKLEIGTPTKYPKNFFPNLQTQLN